MQKVIWKFTLQVGDTNEVEMPKDAEILTAQVQNDEIQLWALVDPSKPDVGNIRTFEIFGTRHSIWCSPAVKRQYISTVQMHGEQLVFHVFEVL